MLQPDKRCSPETPSDTETGVASPMGTRRGAFPLGRSEKQFKKSMKRGEFTGIIS